MKSLDSLSKRILIIALSISLVLLSISAFLLTISRVTAQSPPQAPIVGMGADNGLVYYARWETDANAYVLHKVLGSDGRVLK